MADESTSRDAGSDHNANPASRSGIFIFLPNRLLLALCALQFLLLIALVLVNHLPSREVKVRTETQNHVEQPSTPATTSERYYQGSPGPWGNLEFTRINIEPPDEFAAEEHFPPRQWFFAGYTRSQLAALLKTCDLSAALLSELEASNWVETADGITLSPSEAVILDMPASTRGQLYSVLAESPRNDFQFYPYCFRNGGFEDWFGQSGLSEQTLTLVKRLVYQRGSTICFADVREVWSRIPTEEERHRLSKTLGRNSTVLMKLRVAPETDVSELIKYWTQDGRAKDVKPLLESLKQVPGGMTVDVAHLLPPFARKRLYTFPDPEAYKHAPDCYWSALNFFNDPPDDRYFDDTIWRGELQRDYTIVRKPTFGDLVFLTRPDGIPIHAAVYIADDVVFTKNGANYGQPWMLVKVEDMLARYPENVPIRMTFFHLNSRTALEN